MGRPVHPRKAASVVILRDGASGLEVLLGRRGRTARFMPGRYVFPGGRIQPSDARPLEGETSAADRPWLRGEPSAIRAALRETFEETGILIGRPREPVAAARPRNVVEAAYREAGLGPALDLLRPIGRAITPTASPMRFNVRFFLADGGFASGPFHAGEELDDVAWHPLDGGLPAPMSHVTRFMLRHAIAVWRGKSPPGIPLYWHLRGETRVRWLPHPAAMGAAAD